MEAVKRWSKTVCVFLLQTAIGANGSTILAIPFEFRQVS